MNTDPPIDSPRYSWTQPICERCWLDQEADHLSVRLPVRLTEPSIELCSWCGLPTIFGAYKRADPTTVPFPAVDDE